MGLRLIAFAAETCRIVLHFDAVEHGPLNLLGSAMHSVTSLTGIAPAALQRIHPQERTLTYEENPDATK